MNTHIHTLYCAF